jgi:tetratricopeptide (TPR) repeat protein
MRRAVELLRPMGATSLLGVAVNNLGEVYYQLGDLDSAAECYDESRSICLEIGGYGLGHALHNLGRVYMDLSRIDEAGACFIDAVRAHRASGDLYGEARALKHLGRVCRKKDDIVEARSAWIAAQAIFEQLDEAAEAAEVTAALGSL